MSHTELRRVCLLLIFVVGSFSNLLAQSYSGINWYFGNNDKSIRFTRPTLAPDTLSLPNILGAGGGAVATDAITGEIWFYTDGINVYDRTDFQLATTVDGSTTRNQSVAICENPANSDQYFLFTINNAGAIVQSIFDKTQFRPGGAFPDSPEGNFTSLNNAVAPVTGPLSEGMIILSNDALDGFWLITQTQGGDINVTEIDGTGTFNTTTFATTLTQIDNFSFHPSSNQLAAASAQAGEGVELFDFDPATGAVTASATSLAAITFNGVYDTEWNNSGQYLYASGNFGQPEDSLIRIDLNAVPPTVENIQTFGVTNSFGIQIAPDSTIYHLFEDPAGAFRVGRINDPDTSDVAQVLYDPRPFDVPDFQAEQFPSFLPLIDPDFTLDFSFFGDCQNEPVLFFPEISINPDSVRWDFAGEGNSASLAPSFTFSDAAGSPFTVTLVAFINGQPRAASQQVTINPFDISITLVSDTTFCREDFPPPFGTNGTASVEAEISGTPTSVVWSNGQTGNILVPDSTGFYYVVATDATGCSTYAGVQVNTYGEQDQRGNIWYFGNNAGIDFNPPPPTEAIPFGDASIYNGGNQLRMPEGCAIYCDRNGQPLFYSDGVDVFDREANLLTPANKIGGTAGISQGSSQSVLVLPFPGDETLFYLFTTNEVYNPSGSYELRYSVFDLKLNNGLGGMVLDQNGEISTILCSDVTERLAGNENWVIVHELGNNNFRAYPVLGDGIGTPVISNIGAIHNSELESRGYMKLNGNSNQLAVAYSESTNNNFVELFDFDNATGEVSNYLQLDFNNPVSSAGPVSGQVYGIEFGNNDNNLFASLIGTPSEIFLWHVDTTTIAGNITDPTYIRDSVEVVDLSSLPATDSIGALQLGPDGQMYGAIQNQQFTVTIGNTGTRFGQPVPVANTFGLAAGTSSQLGLPNFIQFSGSSSQNASLAVESGCIDQPLTFTVNNPLNPNLEIYFVSIFPEGDESNVLVGPIQLTQDNPDFTFSLPDPGNYVARFFIDQQCIPQQLITDSDQLFAINPLPTVSNIAVTDPTGCGLPDGSAIVTFSTTGNITYSVSGPVSYPDQTVTTTGSTNVTIPALSAGFYTLNAAFDTGCSETFTFILNDPVPYTLAAVQSQGSDCDDQNGEITVTLSPLAQVPAAYDWVLNEQSTGTTVRTGNQADDPDSDGVFVITGVSTGNYFLELTDNAGCISTVNVSITPPPSITLTLPDQFFQACDVDEIVIPITTNSNSLVELLSQTGDLLTNFRVIGQNDSIAITNPGISGEPIIFGIRALGEDPISCDTTVVIQVIFDNSSPNPFDSRYTLCPFESFESGRQVVMLENPPSGFQSARWFDRNSVEIERINASGASNVTGYRFSQAGDSIIIEIAQPISVELTNAFGCPTVASIDIVQDCKGRINAPSAFYPNSLIPRNRQFVVFPFLILPDDFQIYIFNRWGEMVFQSDNLQFMREQGWNGGYDNDPGRPVPGGGYAYRINYKSQFEPDELKEQRGGVTLIR
ncbi:hypothetical protein FNH22_17545 [Fulvivirga sp. M361]|uniref:T9SS type B sorting domain-containing protein n=1 Tax=Fulvivirga sp. M361 TaxID=2594266 RepID=UPI00117AC34D|nr:gliding motility-associated C-terminal domain-containing protein [Fulvivirga sp. M361]TRX55967.1 hypothetical protein FNH22_17545 [Fulvivirga sp. M361]